ncbi:sulfotransferase family protein [Namhaeicola litoreus]|uniref:Sulfotransferase family protein n=1 Tax=Namhaeicola litoreus TaxID=1052145 RepID=A0ABW3Y6V6_9FLAO
MHKKPNFLIVGAAKSGSTSLYQYINQHPEVFMPINKEPNFFVSEYQELTSKKCPSFQVDRKRMVYKEDDYFKLFDEANPKHKAIGEATVTYLYKPKYAIPKIKKYLDDPKIIIILRNPVKRAFSHYSYARELGFENEEFSNALQLESERLNNNWSSTFAYLDQGLYSHQVQAYIDTFTNVHVIILEEFIKDPQRYLKEVYRFLNIDDKFQNTFAEEHNVSGLPRFKLFHKFLIHDNRTKDFIKKFFGSVISEETLRKIARKSRRLNQTMRLTMDEDTKDYLEAFYRNDIILLEKLLNKNLDVWNN